jgi:nucleotide-binding universal stress UspA family protein
MVTIERVICPVDLSVHSANALRVAASWARWYDAWLHVLHVAPPPQTIVSLTGLVTALPERPLSEITSDVEQFVADTLGPGHDAIVDVVQGHAVGNIIHASTRPHALLVMGTHGWSGLDRLLLGSVAERVAHGTHCPLLVVPPQASPMPSGVTLKQILCAVDFRPSSLAGSRYALSLAQENNARLELVTVLERVRETEISELVEVLRDEGEVRQIPLRKLRERVPDDARLWCDVQENVLTGRPADALLNRADALGADLIVMGTGDRLHLHGVWLGSITGRILRQAHCPVLITPGPERIVLEGAISIPVGDWAGEFDRLTRMHHGEPADDCGHARRSGHGARGRRAAIDGGHAGGSSRALASPDHADEGGRHETHARHPRSVQRPSRHGGRSERRRDARHRARWNGDALRRRRSSSLTCQAGPVRIDITTVAMGRFA